MELNDFIDRGRPRWGRLSLLLDRIESQGLKTLTLEEAREFGRLYRAASSDLLWARSRSASAELVEYLNDLVARGYAQTYPGDRPKLGDALSFFLTGFPRLLRAHWKVFAASYLIFLVGMGFGYAGMWLDPGAGVYLVPEQHQQLDPDQRIKDAGEHRASGEEQSVFASFLFTHNIQVAFFAFALGLTMGLGTAILLFLNGLMLGSLAFVYQSKGHATWFWAWILPHGVPEITAICLAGAAGLVLGAALLAPGRLSRAEALRERGRIAVRLCLGTLPMFVFAGLIEGTLSQIHEPQIPSAVKLIFAAVVAVLLAGWLALAGRDPKVRAAHVA